MPLDFSIHLSDDDLKHFQLIMNQARSSAAHIAPEDIVAGAEGLLQNVGDQQTPAFVRERLETLELMIQMLSDIDWRLPDEHADRVFNALSYFAEPEDLIPDSIPGIGFLDDAIMIEVVARELRPEIEAYRDFLSYRSEQQDKGDNASRESWLEARRAELQNEMRRRIRPGAGKLKDKLFG